MATITEAKLQINVDATTHKAKCVVTAKANFTPYEMNEIKEGLTFKLTCWLMADEPVVPTVVIPIPLHLYPQKSLPDSTPTAVEKITLEATLLQSQLNSGAGADEIYGQLTLTNEYTEVTRTKKTNVVSYSF